MTPGFMLTMTLPAASKAGIEAITIYYTNDGSDPRLRLTGGVAPTAHIYQAPLALTTTTQIKARALAGDPTAGAELAWSALNEATFKVGEPKRRVAITEIMYHPPGGNDYEFIELKNEGDSELNLAGMYFEQGIRYTFPAGLAPLAPGEFIVLVRNPTAFAERYPGVTIAGAYEGKLANQGEKITLRDATGSVLISIHYDDENGWPLSPDGHGDSLIFVQPEGDPNDPHHWRASANRNGSPGAAEPGS